MSGVERLPTSELQRRRKIIPLAAARSQQRGLSALYSQPPPRPCAGWRAGGRDVTSRALRLGAASGGGQGLGSLAAFDGSTVQLKPLRSFWRICTATRLHFFQMFYLINQGISSEASNPKAVTMTSKAQAGVERGSADILHHSVAPEREHTLQFQDLLLWTPKPHHDSRKWCRAPSAPLC